MSDQDRLLEHEYDGIREYDNPTPGWWHVLFLASVVFSIFYYIFWHFSPLAPSIWEAHEAAVTREFRLMFADVGELNPDDRTLLTFTADARWEAVAAGIYASNCAQCHGPRGQGLIGPNLTNDRYTQVRTLHDVYTVIARGAGNGAMPAWDRRLANNELVLVASYVARMRGQDLAGPRPLDEGQPIPPWPEIAALGGTP